jgi:choline kinase
MSTKAIFLAAGENRRFKLPYPKSLLHVNGISLLARSIECVSKYVDTIEVVANPENFKFFQKFSIDELTINPRYQQGSLSSLLACQPFENNYIFDSDIIYNQSQMQYFFKHAKPNSILTSNIDSESNDNVFVSVGEDNTVKRISKIYGNDQSEFVGVACLDKKALNDILPAGQHWEEDGLTQLTNLYQFKIDGLQWNEIDNIVDYKRVQNQKW